jgi:hypothetical protein
MRNVRSATVGLAVSFGTVARVASLSGAIVMNVST